MADLDAATPEFTETMIERMAIALRATGLRVSEGVEDKLYVHAYDNATGAEVVFTLAVTSEEVPF